MSFQLKWRVTLRVAVVCLTVCAWQTVSAGVFHEVKGIVKSVDKDSKTMVVKASDGTEHTIKWTDKTTVEGGKDVSEGVKEGAKVSVKYTEEAGEKTAVGVKHAGKTAADTVK